MMLVHNLFVFGRLLRSAGLDVHTGRLLDVTEALQQVDLGSRDDVYHTCRALLVHRHEDLAAFDRAFDSFWRLGRADQQRRDLAAGDDRRAAGAGGRDAPPRNGSRIPPDDEAGESPGMNGEADAMPIDHATAAAVDEGGEPQGIQTWSDMSRLAQKDFAEFTLEEIVLARAALDRLAWNPGERRTHRWIPGHGSRIDLRRALARSLHTGGDIVKLPTRTRRRRQRDVVLLCDVSGSMERYSRMLLHFAHSLAQRRRRVEAFLFSTDLTRVSRELRTRQIDAAVLRVSRAVPHWSGGTRIGAALRLFHQRWRRRILHGSAVVLLISDGWDRGDPQVLRDEIARLQRSCHRLIWLNPLIGTRDYAPLTRGLQAALPFVDDFLPARTLTNLADLALHLNQLTARRD